MLDFKEPKITDKPWVDQCLSHAHSMNCEYTFGNIFVWRTAYDDPHLPLQRTFC